MPSPEEIQRLCEKAFGGRKLATPRPAPPVERPEPKLSPEEVQQRLKEAFPGRDSVMPRPEQPPEPPPKLTPEEIQQRFNDIFGDMPPRPEPTPPPRQADLSPDELQQRFNEAFAGVPANGWPAGTFHEPPAERPLPAPSPEEIQQRLNEAFARYEWMRSHPAPCPSRRRRSQFRASNPVTGGPSRRQRCDARVKNLIRIGKNGFKVSRGPFCKAWAMENGRCWMHGGASTGPRTPEGKARVVAAMVEGRRKWVARRRVEGMKFPAGRKRGERWTTEHMRERARAEAQRLKGGRFTLDRPLTLALLKSVTGDPHGRARAKAMLDAQELAAMERDRKEALGRINELRAIHGSPAAATIPTALQSVKTGESAYAAPADSDPTAASVMHGQNLALALEHLGKILSRPIAEETGVKDRRLIAKATVTMIGRPAKMP
jgi:hypothetical protein